MEGEGTQREHGKWQDGGVGQKRHPKEEGERDLGTGQVGWEALRLGQIEVGEKGAADWSLAGGQADGME